MQPKRTILTLDHVWIVAALALIAMRPLLTPIPPHDFWWHMATGRIIAQTGSIPTVDTFSYTRLGEPFYNQGWLAQLLLYVSYSIGGIPFILLLQAIIITLAYGLVLWLCLRRSGNVRLSVGVVLLTTMPLSFDNWNVRPQSYAIPLFAAYLLILTGWRNPITDPSATTTISSTHSRPMLWLLPVLMVLWVNIHGTFVLGGGLLAMTFGAEAVRRFLVDRRAPPSSTTIAQRQPLRSLLLWGAVTAAAMLVNPNGILVLGYVLNLLNTSAVTTLVTEWAPPALNDTGGIIFFLFLLVFVVVLIASRRMPDPIDLFMLVPFLFLAVRATRNILWFGIVATPLLVIHMDYLLQRLTKPPQRQRSARGVPFMNNIIIGVIGMLVVLTLPWVKPMLGLPPKLGHLVSSSTPIEAVKVLQQEPDRPQRLFHAMSYGSYLIWAAPEQPVFADPRIELYPYEQWVDYINMNNGRDVEKLLAKYGIDGMLLDNEQQATLLELMQHDPAWEVRYADEWTTYMVWVGRR